MAFYKFDDEFDESDVMFSNYSSDQSIESNQSDDGDKRRMAYNKRKSLKKKPRVRSSSVPVNIPTGISSLRYNDEFDVENFELFDEINDEGEMIRMPPHLIVERRNVNERMARSFSPIKGKNLCQVRNSILRLTGFLEGC